MRTRSGPGGLAAIQQLSRQALAEIRATVGGLRVARLDDELEAARSALGGAGIRAELPAGPQDVDPRHRTVLAWVLREAVTNVVRHSDASSCRVELASNVLRVVDDGRGLGNHPVGNGLRGVRERVEAAGGTLRVADASRRPRHRAGGDDVSEAIKILLADDQALVRGALAALLGLEHDLEVVAEVGRGDEVVAAARRSGAQVCLLDIEMPGADGIEVVGALRRELPGCRSLIVTTFGRPGYLRRALEAGAAGFVVKDTPARQLAEAVRRVHAGLRVVDPELAAESLVEGLNPLTERERDVLRVALSGGTVAVIAARVHLSAGTVRNHLSSAIGKTGTATRAEAARIAQERGWL